MAARQVGAFALHWNLSDRSLKGDEEISQRQKTFLQVIESESPLIFTLAGVCRDIKWGHGKKAQQGGPPTPLVELFERDGSPLYPYKYKKSAEFVIAWRKDSFEKLRGHEESEKKWAAVALKTTRKTVFPISTRLMVGVARLPPVGGRNQVTRDDQVGLLEQVSEALDAHSDVWRCGKVLVGASLNFDLKGDPAEIQWLANQTSLDVLGPDASHALGRKEFFLGRGLPSSLMEVRSYEEILDADATIQGLFHRPVLSLGFPEKKKAKKGEESQVERLAEGVGGLELGKKPPKKEKVEEAGPKKKEEDA